MNIACVMNRFINGGVLTEQDSLVTTRLSDSLSKLMGRKVQVLNISAESWGRIIVKHI